MTTLQLFQAHLVKAAVLVALVGIFYRGRHRQCTTLATYLMAVLTINCLWSLWPDRFFNHSFWLVQQRITDAIKIAVALELAYRTFRAFPGALARARVACSIVLVATTIALVGMPLQSGYDQVVTHWQPRLMSGTIWLMTATMVLVVWYRLPVTHFHRAVLLGFSTYLMIFTTLMNTIRALGWRVREGANVVDGLAYLALIVWWAYESWRPMESPATASVVREAPVERIA